MSCCATTHINIFYCSCWELYSKEYSFAMSSHFLSCRSLYTIREKNYSGQSFPANSRFSDPRVTKLCLPHFWQSIIVFGCHYCGAFKHPSISHLFKDNINYKKNNFHFSAAVTPHFLRVCWHFHSLARETTNKQSVVMNYITETWLAFVV